MELLDQIKQRRTIRKYTTQKVEREKLEKIVEAGLNAPNAGGGQGCEAFTWKGYKYKEAVNICEQLRDEGFKNRGVKDGSAFYVIKKTTMTAILLEVCFLDNRKDCELYRQIGVKRIAQAIADGIS